MSVYVVLKDFYLSQFVFVIMWCIYIRLSVKNFFVLPVKLLT